MPYPLLFRPFPLNKVSLPNRIVLPAMVTRLSGEDGAVNQDILDRYTRFARGEPGMIVVEAMAVHTAKSGPLLRICDDEYKPGLTELARRVHDAGPSMVLPQIIHFLKIARSGWRQLITDLSREDIRGIVLAYGAAARRARECGYDGVELHMAHAYTLSSFLSARNLRRDEYGGSLANRMRLMEEVIAEVRRCVGRDFLLGVRFDGEECIKGGYSVPDARAIALRMAQLTVDYVSISAGGKFEDAIHKPGAPLYPYTGYSGDRCMPGADYPDGLNVYIAAGIKEWLVRHGFATPVVVTGKISNPAFAERLLAEGKADLIGMARPLLADPDWPRKVREGREETVVQCVYGNICKNLDENFKKVVCVLWPQGRLQAPESEDREPPQWPVKDALTATVKDGRVFLKWTQAADNEAVRGYMIYRSAAGEPERHIGSNKAHLFTDPDAAAGTEYTYRVRPYDVAGNRGEYSNAVTVAVPAGA
jgi:2,4-dienoyl-CoA reductase-like NADH-dependent reductase (Old Yellow Enzyme family)